MNTRVLTSCLTLSLVLTGCAADDGGPGASTTAPTSSTGPVSVESTEIRTLEGVPVQVRLVVEGSVPTPCHEVRWEVEDVGWALDVGLWSTTDPAHLCDQVLEPFEASIPLGAFESATRVVLLNGEPVGRVEVAAPEPSRDAFLVAAGWSFGMCGGYCNADMTLDGDEVVLTGWSRMSEAPLYVHRAELTAVARDRIGAAVARVAEVTLDSVYGCPDCADGGAAYLEVVRHGVASRHDMDFARPPDVLTDLYDLAMAMIGALEGCAPSELVVVDDACEPWQAS
jgi:hypothetical protein